MAHPFVSVTSEMLWHSYTLKSLQQEMLDDVMHIGLVMSFCVLVETKVRPFLDISPNVWKVGRE